MTALSTLGQQLVVYLAAAAQRRDAAVAARRDEEKINVVGAGKALTAAYEQLRNAAENTEEHLLLQNAIRRFYKQLFIIRDETAVRTSGNELAVELTLAGYVANDTLTKSQLDEISRLAIEHYQAYESLQGRRDVNSDKAFGWILSTLAVMVEGVLSDHTKDVAFVDFSYVYFTKLIPESTVATEKNRSDYGAALYAAIHKALLKSNPAVVRSGLLERYGVTVLNLDHYVALNAHIDALLESSLTEKLYHIVDRQGAPLRIVRHMIDEREDLAPLLEKRESFLEAYEQQVGREYEHITSRVNRAIVRSVIFLIITKFLIGVAIEVPYDLWAHDEILWMPLVINLLFPPVYMIALRLTHALPGYANTTALVERIDAMLYGEKVMLVKNQLSAKRYNAVFSFMYTVLGLGVFAGVVYGLLQLNFSFVHIAIFFLFVSTASFLGFRLSRLIREIEVVRSASNGLTLLRDFVYLPFVVVGRWISDKYSKVNIVTIVLDMLIELPLKTVLRLVRQWSAFIDDRKDRIS